MSRTLVFILALMLSLQSMFAVADLHGLPLDETGYGSVVADAHTHAEHHDQHLVAESADQEQCRHCCHCHQGSVYFPAGNTPCLFSDSAAASLFAKNLFFTSWIGSPDLRPPSA